MIKETNNKNIDDRSAFIISSLLRASRPSLCKLRMERDVNAKIIEQQLKPLAGTQKLSKLLVVWTNEGEYGETCEFALLIG
jgi:hypothetical protein